MTEDVARDAVIVDSDVTGRSPQADDGSEIAFRMLHVFEFRGRPDQPRERLDRGHPMTTTTQGGVPINEHKTLNTVVHAAFRRDLRRFDAALAAFPDGDQRRAADLVVAWDNFEAQLRQHDDDEEQHFWPALRELGVDDALVGDLDGEHSAMLRSAAEAGTAMHALADRPTTSSAASARERVAVLGSALLPHLEHEERDLEPFSASRHGTPQVKAAQKAVVRSHLKTIGTFIAWLSDDADPPALAQIRRDVPAPVLFVVRRLGGRWYRRRIAPTWAA